MLGSAQHPDRDRQFRLINERVGATIAAGEPAISIDTRKKELVGEFKNAGRECAVAVLGRVDFSPAALRADMRGPRTAPGYLYSR
jgi:hypothetical protein